MSLIQQFGNEKGLEKVAALATGIVTTHFFVTPCEHDEEIVNHFVIQPLYEEKSNNKYKVMNERVGIVQRYNQKRTRGINKEKTLQQLLLTCPGRKR